MERRIKHNINPQVLDRLDDFYLANLEWRMACGIHNEGPLELAPKLFTEADEFEAAVLTRDRQEIAGEAADILIFGMNVISSLGIHIEDAFSNSHYKIKTLSELQLHTVKDIKNNEFKTPDDLLLLFADKRKQLDRAINQGNKEESALQTIEMIYCVATVLTLINVRLESAVSAKLTRNQLKYNPWKIAQADPIIYNLFLRECAEEDSEEFVDEHRRAVETLNPDYSSMLEAREAWEKWMDREIMEAYGITNN